MPKVMFGELTVIQFSGGRTSGKMLYDYLEEFGGLPPSTKVIFNNTGREMEETLEFVQEVSERWGVPIVWTEYRSDRSKAVVAPDGNIGRHSYTIVDFKTASRNGEPFEEVIETYSTYRKETGNRGDILPNPVQRLCTAQMKKRTTERFAAGLGVTFLTTLLGLRYDEPKRVAKVIAGSTSTRVCKCPLYEHKVTREDVMNFWASQPFDLRLPDDPTLQTYQGNCDFCFLKSAAKIKKLATEYPERLKWWVEMEKRTGTNFRKDRFSYTDLAEGRVPLKMLCETTELDDCNCTD